MSRFDEFEKAYVEIQKLRNLVMDPTLADLTGVDLVQPLIETRIAALKAIFDEPAPVPVEPVKPKAKRGDVDGAVKVKLNLGDGHTLDTDGWGAWAKQEGFNRKSVLAAVRRHAEKNKT